MTLKCDTCGSAKWIACVPGTAPDAPIAWCAKHWPWGKKT